MSKERKLLKIICFLYVLDAIACLIFGGVTLAGMGVLDASDVVTVGGIDFDLQAWALIFGIWGIVTRNGPILRGVLAPRMPAPAKMR